MDSRRPEAPGKKEEDDDNPAVTFANLDKGQLLQEKRIFSETPLNPRKCRFLITKLLYLVTVLPGQNPSQQLTRQEATDLFFSTTKLFQSKDVCLFFELLFI